VTFRSDVAPGVGPADYAPRGGEIGAVAIEGNICRDMRGECSTRSCRAGRTPFPLPRSPLAPRTPPASERRATRPRGSANDANDPYAAAATGSAGGTAPSSAYSGGAIRR
jgi:hypothetical protein